MNKQRGGKNEREGEWKERRKRKDKRSIRE